MQKLTMHTANIADQNFQKLAALFPQAVTESVVDGEVVRVIDKDVLMQEIGAHVVEGPNRGENQRYQFTWPDKAKTVHAANQPLHKTLRPVRSESVNFDTTENLYIEGDNLEVLKLLQETYLGKVKMIYIDPPYNTGNDFVYSDKFAMNRDEYDDINGDYDDEGNRLVKNTESNGRFHTDWLNMMYPRLKVARDLLSDDGVIFISIDDNEQENLKKICDEVYGADNFVAQLIWERAFAPKNDAKYVSNSHDYVLIYAKSISNFTIGKLERTEEANNRYTNLDNDSRGLWISDNLTVKTYSAKYDYAIITPSGRTVNPPHGSCWRVSKERFAELVADNRVWFGKDGGNVPRLKRFLSEVQDGMTPTSIWKHVDVGHNQEGRQEVKKLFDDKGFFDGPKPIRLLRRILTLAKTSKDSIILDFFSGSATTAHAVMQLNAEDGGKRKFIMVQLPEETPEKSEARKAGYTNICEIGKERIRRAGAKILENMQGDTAKDNAPLLAMTEQQKEKIQLDVGFRVLKVDETNMTKVYYSPKEYNQEMLSLLDTNIKADRTPEDLLFQVMLELGIPLSSRIEENALHGKKVFQVYHADALYLVASFDENLTEAIITEIAQKTPFYFVMRDSSQASDSVATNFEEIFKLNSPTTQTRVL